MHTPKSPDAERLHVRDLQGLINRKVFASTGAPPPVSKPVTKSPPVPVLIPGASLLQQAIGIYNGWIEFDHWLNLSTTTWSVARKVLWILKGERAVALTYLREIRLQDDTATAGLMAGKLMAMQAICIFRELHQQLTIHAEIPYAEVSSLAGRLNHFVYLTPNSNDLFKQILSLDSPFSTLDDFELKLFSIYWPVNNLLHARRIFKSRVKKVVLDDFYNILLRDDYDVAFATHFLIGVFNRLCFFNPDNRRADLSIDHLEKIIRLYKLIIPHDPLFVRHTINLVISDFIGNRFFRPEPVLAWYFFRTIYLAAMQDKSLHDMMQSLVDLARSLEVKIYVHPHSLAMVYRAIPFFDLDWANRELEEVVIVSVH